MVWVSTFGHPGRLDDDPAERRARLGTPAELCRVRLSIDFLVLFWSPAMARSGQWRRETSVPFQFLQNELARFLEGYLQPEAAGGPQRPPTDLEPTGWTPSVDVY